MSTGGLDLEFFQDYNPSPIGAYELKRLPGSSVALVAGDDVAVAWPDLVNGTDALNGPLGNAVVGGLLSGRARKLVDGQATLAVEGEGGGLELVLLREEEDERASLALV